MSPVNGLKILVNGKMLAGVNLRRIGRAVNINKERVLKVMLPEEIVPRVVGNETVEILHAEFGRSGIYGISPKAILNGWKMLEESFDIRISEITKYQTILELQRYAATGFIAAVPRVIAPLSISGYSYGLHTSQNVHNCESKIEEFNNQVGKRLLDKIPKAIEDGKAKILQDFERKLASYSVEFKVITDIAKSGYSIEVNKSRESPDLYLEGSIPVEISAFYGKNLKRKIKKEAKQGDIIILDVTSHFVGIPLVVEKFFGKTSMGIREALKVASRIIEQGSKAVILYMKTPNNITNAKVLSFGI
ncbi:hypothetical protein NF865_07160 [Thermococcus aggregans]|uniref:Uncharacterized protein n=1 Tax=Thermococcus aggregans TaxID=110163 RepID=A0A9E7MWA9_THEAG|nr:hypothetical protein [Thermococcus aggregans]USS40111.1 hypothetical protein NF865_07160 [Thermococcus aggregans]